MLLACWKSNRGPPGNICFEREAAKNTPSRARTSEISGRSPTFGSAANRSLPSESDANLLLGDPTVTAKKKGALVFTRTPFGATPRCERGGLEGQLRLQLDQPRGSIAAEERPENAGRRAYQTEGLPENAASNVVVREAEVRVVEEVEELETDSQL